MSVPNLQECNCIDFFLKIYNSWGNTNNKIVNIEKWDHSFQQLILNNWIAELPNIEVLHFHCQKVQPGITSKYLVKGKFWNSIPDGAHMQKESSKEDSMIWTMA